MRKSRIILLAVIVLCLGCTLFACNKDIDIGVRFMVDDSEYAVVKTSGQETIALPKDPVKDGYVFRGWFWDKGTWQNAFTINSLLNQPLSESIQVYAYFITQEEADSIKTVTFNSMGGPEVSEVTLRVGSLITEPDKITKDGYIFVGWYREADFTTKWNFKSDTVQESMTLYAKWVDDIPENRLYTVAFNSNGGSAVESCVDIVYDTTIKKPANPVLDGYALVGWYTDNTFAVEWNFDLDKITENKTLYARWERADVSACALIGAAGFQQTGTDLYIKVPNVQDTFSFLDKITVSPFASWKIVNDLQGKDEVPSGTVEIGVGDNVKYILVTSYDGLHKNFYKATIRRKPLYSVTINHNNGTSEKTSADYEEDSKVTFPEISKTGYTISGWAIGDDFWDIEQDTVQSNLTLDAVWTANAYTVTFDSNGGSDIEQKAVTYDSGFSFAVPQKAGYSFGGWKIGETSLTNAAGEGLSVWNLTDDVEVAAIWNVISYSLTYTNIKGALNDNAASYTTEQSVTLGTISQDGYVFINWTDENGDEISAIPVGSVGNKTIRANWTLIEYTLTFQADGQKVGDGYKFNVETTSVTEPEIPAKNGYTSAWEDYSFPARDITVNAIYTPIIYNITYVDAGIHSNPSTYTIESEEFEIGVPARVGYTFQGWYSDASLQTIANTAVAKGSVGDLTFYAKWTPIVYGIEYQLNGGVNNSNNPATYTIESEEFEIGVPARVGYTFQGWYSDASLQTIANSTIAKGSVGDLTFYAKWTPIVYSITYNLNKGTNSLDNPLTYTIETSTITLSTPIRYGYTFDNWTENGQVVTEIALGSYGNKVITANWTAITYNLYLVMENESGGYDGHYADASNPETYDIEDEFVFISPVCDILGYEFKGWYTTKNDGVRVEGIELGSTGDKTYYAQWKRSEYTITYHNIDDATNSNPNSYNVESDTFILNTPSKIGYTFVGWFSDAAIQTPANTTVAKGSVGKLDFYAKWEATEYAVNYELYGGVNNAENPATYTIETETFAFKAPAKDGYSFGGWFDGSDFVTGVTGISKGSTGVRTVYAKWYWVATVTFETNGGSAVAPVKQEYGTPLTAPSTSRNYYTFGGWYADAQLTVPYTFTTMPDADFTLYAKWIPVEYSITYVLNGGENSSSNPAKYDTETAITFAEASKTGYSFVAWYTDSLFTSAPVDGIPLGSHGNITLYANYSINKYTITFEANGGSSVTPIEQDYDTAVSAPASPARTGYRFDGWYTANDELYVFDRIEAENITLTAKWSLIEYTINYNLDGGTNSPDNPAVYTLTSETIVLSAPTKRGYNFAGWYTDGTYTQSVAQIPSGSYGNIDVQAKWTIIDYDIVYIGVDGLVNPNPATYTVEDAVTFEEIAKKGHTFNGLFAESGLSTRIEAIKQGTIGEITVYASYTVNSYDVWMDGKQDAVGVISFNLNGASGSVPSQTVTATEALTYPSIPERNGYIFGGWYADINCTGAPFDFSDVIASDKTLYAKWLPITGESLAIGANTLVNIDGTALREFTFVPLVSGNVSMTTTGAVDTFGYLYNAAGELLKANDDGNDSNFLIKYNVTAGEKYVLKVRGYGKAAKGQATLYLSGSTAVADGGLAVIAGGKVRVEFGSSFTLTVPAAREGYVFRGYRDADGVKYVGADGMSVKNFDKDEETVFYSIWEVDGFDVTFVTNGGTAVQTVTIPRGARLDINDFVTTRTGYSFTGWYLSAGDQESYNASVMPDHDLTLYAKWTSYALNAIKYDESIGVVSEFNAITADTFGATCFDTDGVMVDLTVTINGSQTAGETITVRYTASKNGKTKTATISNVKVYGNPTLAVGESKDYINLKDGLVPTWFSATATDTYGASITPVVSIDGDYAAGDIVTVKITATDAAGNLVTQTIENVRLYGLPIISYNAELAGISQSYDGSAPALGATAADSFGDNVAVTAEITGTLTAGQTVIITFTATDPKGNVSTLIVKNVKVYGTPSISGPEKTDFKVDETITVDNLGLSATDTFGGAATAVIELTNGTQTAGSTLTYLVRATDVLGNVSTKEITVKVFGAIALTVENTDISAVTEITPDRLKAAARDSFGRPLVLTVTFVSGALEGGQTVVYNFAATDAAGNLLDENVTFVVYAAEDITLSYDAFSNDKIKITSKGEEFSASATDSYGNSCAITLEVENGALTAGRIQTVRIVATDRVGNRKLSDPIANVRVYGTPTFTYAHEYLYIKSGEDVSFMFTAHDSFGDELYAAIATESETADILTVSVTATDDAANIATKQFELVKIAAESYLALFVGDKQVGYETVTSGQSYTLPHEFKEFVGYTLKNGWKLNGKLVTDANGSSLAVWSEADGEYRLDADVTPVVYNVTYNLDGGVNSPDNPSSFTVVSLGGADGEIALSDPTKITLDSIIVNNEGAFERKVTAYTFLGWFSDEGFLAEVTSLSLAAGSITLYAKWSSTTTTTTYIGAYLRINADGTPNASGSYILFGQYPQTIKANDVTISGGADAQGYYTGSDGCKYAKVVSSPYGSGYTFSTGASVSSGTTYYFKVEPLKWRILNEGNGKALILCESIIDNKAYDAGSNNYANSDIRAWLNNQFYNTAFTSLQQQLIQVTNVDNSAASTGYSFNPYACANTNDKIFLPSYKEMVDSSYGFAASSSAYDTARRRITSDYARSKGVYMSTDSSYYGNGDWWLRSSYYRDSTFARYVNRHGYADLSNNVHYTNNVSSTDNGVVPALTISLE